MVSSEKLQPTILLIATLDTKYKEVGYLRSIIISLGCKVEVVDCGIFQRQEVEEGYAVGISSAEVADAGGISLEKLIQSGDKYMCIATMIRGIEALTKKMFQEKKFQGIIGIGGAQGTDIGTAAMRALPFGIPKLMVSTIANGLTTFGPYVGTKDVTIMHSVADLQGLNVLTQRVLQNAAASIVGMTKQYSKTENLQVKGIPVALSMLGTTTPGALMVNEFLEPRGFQVVAFHQNGTGGIAMEDMISEGYFKGVLDLNLHEIGDLVGGGLHQAIRNDRFEKAGEMGIPQVVAPGSINYAVKGPLMKLSDEDKARKYVVHNPNLTLVRLSSDELIKTGEIIAAKLNKAKGPLKVFLPLRGFSSPDREGLPLWDYDDNKLFIVTLEQNLNPNIPLYEIDAHINDCMFINIVVESFFEMMTDNL